MTTSDAGDHEEDIPNRLQTTSSTDPGDETERNFRYQHQYGVVLLAATLRGYKDYVSFYCEHHEDFLAERPDGLFDGYQIKTQRPENGAWTLKSPALSKSLGRFVDLLKAFPAEVGKFFFVSNTEVDTVTPVSHDDTRRSYCPNLMIQHVRSCSDPTNIQPPFRKAFDAVAAELGADKEQLFQVLQRLEIVKGPSRGEFDASLAQEHIGGLPECSHLVPGALSDLCNDLVAYFHRAASLYVTDPDRHLLGPSSWTTDNPTIKAKRIVCADVVLVPRTKSLQTFRYQGEPTTRIGRPRSKRVLEQKLERGDIADIIPYMKEREEATEYHFLEEQAKDPRAAPQHLRQVEAAVHGECLEAFMAAKTSTGPFGRPMFNDVTSRLRALEIQRKYLLGGEPYEVLMGMAALLTSECRVWWSERFQLDGGET